MLFRLSSSQQIAIELQNVYGQKLRPVFCKLDFNGLQTARPKIVAMQQRFGPSFAGQRSLPLMITDQRKKLDIIERAHPNNRKAAACRPLDVGRVSTIGLV